MNLVLVLFLLFFKIVSKIIWVGVSLVVLSLLIVLSPLVEIIYDPNGSVLKLFFAPAFWGKWLVSILFNLVLGVNMPLPSIEGYSPMTLSVDLLISASYWSILFSLIVLAVR